MEKLFIALIFFFTLSSCYNVNQSEPVVPDILLSKPQMVDILTEIQLTEAGFNFKKNRIKANELKPEYYDKILQHYGITLQQLRDNINYYNEYPKIMEEIYESVLAKLSKIHSEAILEKEEYDKKIASDSISHIADSLKLIGADSLIERQKE